jgi:phosphoribosylaminoimidazolecarboxamide formyltransferase/IMP cyclohydrolase
MQLAGLAGNRGRNLLNIADREPGGATLGVVLTDDADAPVLGAAADRGIPTAVVEPDDGESRADHERRLLEALAGHDADYVCLDGYMRVLGGTYLGEAPPTLNVHPSLLPAFPGRSAHEDVLAAGVRVSGATVHVVTETVDGGPILTQEPVPVRADDTVADLKQRVLQEAEFRAYPRAIAALAEGRATIEGFGERPTVEFEEAADEFPDRRLVSNDRVRELRYGENPHQSAALYADPTCEEANVVAAAQRNEGAKALSYNNYNDAGAALELAAEFDEPAAAVIKHTNPAGCATADALVDAYERALATDPMSAFGGVVALNRPCDAATAGAVADSYKEVVVAPGYTDDALATLREEDDLRVLEVGSMDGAIDPYTEKPLVGGRLVQERDLRDVTREDLEVVTEREPTDAQVETMLFAWRAIKHVKSNAILLADGTETVGIGAGQMSRVDAVRLAGTKATEHAEGKGPEGTVLASDAFFPFPDGVEAAADYGVEAVVQPGGSVNDDEVVAACDERGLAMCLTGQRAFRHD